MPWSSELPAQCRNIHLQPWSSYPHTTLFLGRGEVFLGSFCTGPEELVSLQFISYGLVWVTCPLMTKLPKCFLKGRERNRYWRDNKCLKNKEETPKRPAVGQSPCLWASGDSIWDLFTALGRMTVSLSDWSWTQQSLFQYFRFC